MKYLLLALFLVGAAVGRAHALPPSCPDGYVLTQNRGCVELRTLANDAYVTALKTLPTDPVKAVALFERACRGGHGPSCTEAAHIYSSGRNRVEGTKWTELIKKDHVKAVKLWERGCDLGDGAGCQKRGNEEDFGTAASKKWFERGCTHGDGTACAQLAYAFETGKPPDPAKAKTYFTRARTLLEHQCKKAAAHNDGQACWVRGYLIEQAAAGYTKDAAAAQEAYELSCQAGFADGCWHLAKAFDDRKDDSAALDAYMRACKADRSDACSEAAIRAANADADKRSPVPLDLARHGCELTKKECWAYAEMFRIGAGTAKNPAMALSMYRESCDAGEQWSCVRYVEHRHKGDGAPSDRPLENDMLDKACNASEWYACELLGLYLSNDTNPDDARATKAAEIGCKNGRYHACYIQAWIIRYRHVPKVEDAIAAKEAVPIFERGCTGNGTSYAPFGCREAALIYEAGLGIDKNLAKALELHQKACDATVDTQAASCEAVANLATGDHRRVLHATARACGHGIDAKCMVLYDLVHTADDIQSALAQLSNACTGGSTAECYGRAMVEIHGTSSEKRSAMISLSRACAQRLEAACVSEGLAYYNGEGGTVDKERAEQLFRRHCDDGMGLACHRLALLLENDKKDGANALRYAEQACSLKIADACNTAGFIYYTAQKGVIKDMARAAEFYAKGCELGGALACSNQAELYRYGIVVAKDHAKAYELYKKSCASNEPAGCTGEAYYLGTGGGGATKELKRAIELDRLACEAGSSEACADLARFLEADHGPKSEIARLQDKAFDLTQKNAESGNPEYMYWLGTFYRDGMSTMKNPAKAREWFVKSCESFDPLGCMAAGHALETSTVPAEREQARVFFHRACVANIGDSCDREKAMAGPMVGGGGKSSTGPGKVKAKGCGGCESGGASGEGVIVLALCALFVRRRRRS
jgi:TPR repeat protein